MREYYFEKYTSLDTRTLSYNPNSWFSKCINERVKNGGWKVQHFTINYKTNIDGSQYEIVAVLYYRKIKKGTKNERK